MDTSTDGWDVVVDGVEKKVLRNTGCHGVAALSALDALVQPFRQQTQTAD